MRELADRTLSLPPLRVVWPGPGTVAILLVGMAALVLLFWPTARSALHLWESSSAYTHGYLIAPISAYLVWEERNALRTMNAEPSLWGVLVIAIFSAAWLIADLLGIDQGRHLALVGMIQGMFLAALGTSIYRKIAFALNYLWLMVPAGDFLVPALQQIAHAGSVVLLKASAIPVFADGLLIEVPQETFLVEAGCAGLNFFLSALALSLVYGRLMYRTWPARIACVAVALLASVLANIVRIYLIIALTEWSEQKIGLADDHLLFGWGFFAVAMLALMWSGLRFTHPKKAPSIEPALFSPTPSFFRRGCTLAAAIAVAAIAPALTKASVPVAAIPHAISLSEEYGPWRMQQLPISKWSPAIVSGDAKLQASYEHDGHAVELAVTVYAAQRDGREAAAAGNGPAETPRWQVIGTAHQPLSVSGIDFKAAAATVEGDSSKRIVLYWYDTAGCLTASRLLAKICAARERIQGRVATGAFVAVSSAYTNDPDTAQRALRDFAANLTPFATAAPHSSFEGN